MQAKGGRKSGRQGGSKGGKGNCRQRQHGAARLRGWCPRTMTLCPQSREFQKDFAYIYLPAVWHGARRHGWCRQRECAHPPAQCSARTRTCCRAAACLRRRNNSDAHAHHSVTWCEGVMGGVRCWMRLTVAPVGGKLACSCAAPEGKCSAESRGRKDERAKASFSDTDPQTRRHQATAVD